VAELTFNPVLLIKWCSLKNKRIFDLERTWERSWSQTPHLSHKETEEQKENVICFQYHWLLVTELGMEPRDLASENMHISGFFTRHCVQLWGGNPQRGVLSGIMWSLPPLLSSLTSCWQDSPLSFHMDFLVIPQTHSFSDGLALPLSRKLFSWSFLFSQFKPLLKCPSKRGLLYQN